MALPAFARTRLGFFSFLVTFSLALGLVLSPDRAQAGSDFPLSSSESAPQKIKPGKAYLRVLSYNIKGLPSLINSYKKSRFPIIGQMLKERRKNGTAPDIVLLQESFISPTHVIQTISGYPHIANGPGKSGVTADGEKYSKLLTSGIFIMSEHPFVAEQTTTFPKKMCATWDCLANKGAQMVKVRVPNIPFDIWILNTHSQAEPPHEAVRENQFKWINNFARSNFDYNKPYEALLFGGDINSSPERPSFSFVRDLVDVTSVGEVCMSPRTDCVVDKKADPKWVLQLSQDQLFYRSGHKVKIRPMTFERNFTEMHKGKMLSDHLGYEVLFEISWE